MCRFSMLLLSVVLMVALLCSCSRNHAVKEEAAGIVIKVTIDHYPEDSLPHRLYTDPAKIQNVLNFLHDLELTEPNSAEPESNGTMWQICLDYGNGQRKYYYLLGGRYFREGTEPWQLIDEDSPQNFGTILSKNKSDIESFPETAPTDSAISTEKYKIPAP